MDLTAKALLRAIKLLQRTLETSTDDTPPCLAEQLLLANDRPQRRQSLFTLSATQVYVIPSEALGLHFYRRSLEPAPWWTRVRQNLSRWRSAPGSSCS